MTNYIINSKSRPQFFYLKVLIQPAVNLELDHIQMKSMINQGLKELFGDLGASLLVDVLSFKSVEKEMILRVEQKGLQQLWSTLSWFLTYRGTKVVFKVQKVSSCLLNLATDSRNYQHHIISTI